MSLKSVFMTLTALVLFWISVLQALGALDNRRAECSKALPNGRTNGNEDCLDAFPAIHKWQTAGFTASFQAFTEFSAQVLCAAANEGCCRFKTFST